MACPVSSCVVIVSCTIETEVSNSLLIASCAASTHLNQAYKLVAATDIVLDSSVAKFSPSDCQRPEVLNRNKVKGAILLCGYSFNFILGTASVKKVAETARALGAVGFILAVENVSPGTKFDPVPVSIPGIVITQVDKSKVNFTFLEPFSMPTLFIVFLCAFLFFGCS